VETPVAIGLIAVTLLFLLRRYAARRVAARRGRFVWLYFLPTLFGSLVILWASIQLFSNAPLLSVVMTIVGLVYFAALVRLLTLVSSSITAAKSQDELVTAVTEPMVDYSVTIMGLVLIVGLLALVAVIIWGLSQPAH
jgi:hypothetical protein